MWIFGYGSLIWKVDFPYEERMTGYINGFERKFYQYSTDHRGTPENPGRVVNLVPTDNKKNQVWGAAYKIKDSNISDVLKHLDYREKGGYERMNVTFHPGAAEQASFKVIMYIGSDKNINYAGEADDMTIANQIVHAVGPSGSNIEYVCKLAEAIRNISTSIKDEHLFSVESKVLSLISQSNEIIDKIPKKVCNICDITKDNSIISDRKTTKEQVDL